MKINPPANPASYALKLSKLLFIILFFKGNFATGQLISNISASTGHAYTVSTFTKNVVIYTDRTYQATSLPSYLSNAPFIKTPNDDKYSTSSVSFNLSQNATVYIGYDPAATVLPAWLQSWQKLAGVIGITDPRIDHFNVFSKSFPAGKVTIGGNVASPAAGVKNMSIIIAVASNSSNKPPTVNITNPANNASINATTVTINASAADADGSVAKVDFYNGSTLVGTDNSNPYSFIWNNMRAGKYSLTAKATDNGGLATISSAVSITVTTPGTTSPSVTITIPKTDTVYTTVPASVKLFATATAFNTTIKKVEFFKGSSLVNTQVSAPYTYTLANVPLGTYIFTAKVTDNKGASTVSAGVSIGVHNKPSVTSVNPSNSATGVDRDASISTNVLKLPNGGIDNLTIASSAVYLTENTSGALVPSNVNGTGGGDAITLVPSGTLKPKTVYKFHITAAVKDLSGTPFVPFTSTFTTNSGSTRLTTIQFEKVALPNTTGRHTCVTVGPDRKLYALVDDGLIERYVIKADGTLSGPELLYSLQDSYVPRQKTLAICLTFDPSSTANNLIAWVSHCNTYVFTNAPDWDDKITKLSGSNLQNVQDVLINLPRSSKDHVTNSIAFGPDGALYFTQGSTSAMGRADQTWNLRNEHLLSGSVLRLDRSKLGTLPLNLKTSEGGGTYNPYAANAPLTIYASGVRNSYDLVWHSNGNLYVATNGSAAGGNTPGSVSGTKRPDGSAYHGPVVPALTNVQQTMEDFLYRIVKGGYYGHPNPLRGEYVMNGGNPSSSKDGAEVPAYPVGTLPDANWRGNIFNFQNNTSPNGFIEYKSNAFSGALKGKLIFVRYSAHDDLITLTPGPSNNITAAVDGVSIPGFSGFVDPLDLTEDVATGNIYVSEYGGSTGKITLLRPTTATMSRSAAAKRSNSVASTSAHPINTISGCDAGIEVEVAEDKIASLITTRQPKISPNPITNKFNIQFPTTYEGEYTLQIVEISGRVYQIGKINLKGGANMAIDISKLSLKPGTYFLKLISGNKKSEVFKLSVNN